MPNSAHPRMSFTSHGYLQPRLSEKTGLYRESVWAGLWEHKASWAVNHWAPVCCPVKRYDRGHLQQGMSGVKAPLQKQAEQLSWDQWRGVEGTEDSSPSP